MSRTDLRELEALVEKRKQEALSKDIFGKAELICTCFGKRFHLFGSERYTPDRSTYNSRKFLIESWIWDRHDTKLPLCRIIYDGKTVFVGASQGYKPDNTRNIDIDCYVPGLWIPPFESLAKRAQAKYERVYVKREAEVELICTREDSLKERFES